MSKITVFFLAISLSFITVAADFLIKKASLENQIWNRSLLFGCLLYALTGIGWALTMRSMNLSALGVIYGVSCIILLALIGIFIFQEKTSSMEIIGMMMGIGSLMLLYKFM